MSGSKSTSETQSSSDVWRQQSPFLQDLYNQAQGAVPGMQNQANQLTGQMQQPWLQAMNPQGNPYLEQMGQTGLDQINRNLTQDILPSINNEAMGGMNLGSSRQGIAEGLATQGAQIAGGDYLTNLYGQQYQQDQNRAMQAMQMAPIFQQMQNNPLQQYAGLLGGPAMTSQSSGESKRIGGGIGAN